MPEATGTKVLQLRRHDHMRSHALASKKHVCRRLTGMDNMPQLLFFRAIRLTGGTFSQLSTENHITCAGNANTGIPFCVGGYTNDSTPSVQQYAGEVEAREDLWEN